MKKLILGFVLLSLTQACLALAPYMNPDYWYRAYLRDQFKTATAAVKSVQLRLTKALGDGQAFGGDVLEADLPNYHYMFGADHIAGLPYELFIVGNKVYATYARYRIALAWPALGMGQFMGIINAPEAIRTTLGRVAGGTGAKQ